MKERIASRRERERGCLSFACFCCREEERRQGGVAGMFQEEEF